MRRIRRVSRWALPWATVAVVGCGGASAANAGRYVVDLNHAIGEPVADADANAANSRLVQDVVDTQALDGLSRVEVRARIGEGEPCRHYDRCLDLGFDGDDWYYTVGVPQQGFEGTLPVLIVGFDQFGVVSRVWNLRVH